MTLLRRARHFASIVTLTAVLGMAALIAQTTSQPPTAPRQARESNPDSSADDEKPAQPPINVTVTVPEEDPETLKRREEREERQVAANESISLFTGLLTGLTLVSALLTGFGLWITLKAAKAAEKGANAAKESATVANQTMLLTHRPHIRIRGIGIKDSATAGGRPIARVQLANIGAGEAVRITYNVGWFVWKTLPSENPAAAPVISGVLIDDNRVGATHGIEMATIRAGMSRFIETVQVPQGLVTAAKLETHYDWVEGGEDYVTGRVRYEDSAGRPRVTGFCRRLNKTTGRFERVEDPDYEYEE